MKIKVTYECFDGGHGWGETGDKNSLVFPKPSPVEYYLSHAPGGWKVIHVEKYEESS